METHFHHWIKKKKKGNRDFISRNSNFFLRTARCKVRIVGYKVYISQFWEKKSESQIYDKLRDINSQFKLKKNLAIASLKKVRIVR